MSSKEQPRASPQLQYHRPTTSHLLAGPNARAPNFNLLWPPRGGDATTRLKSRPSGSLASSDSSLPFALSAARTPARVSNALLDLPNPSAPKVKLDLRKPPCDFVPSSEKSSEPLDLSHGPSRRFWYSNQAPSLKSQSRLLHGVKPSPIRSSKDTPRSVGIQPPSPRGYAKGGQGLRKSTNWPGDDENPGRRRAPSASYDDMEIPTSPTMGHTLLPPSQSRTRDVITTPEDVITGHESVYDTTSAAPIDFLEPGEVSKTGSSDSDKVSRMKIQVLPL